MNLAIVAKIPQALFLHSMHIFLLTVKIFFFFFLPLDANIGHMSTSSMCNLGLDQFHRVVNFRICNWSGRQTGIYFTKKCLKILKVLKLYKYAV